MYILILIKTANESGQGDSFEAQLFQNEINFLHTVMPKGLSIQLSSKFKQKRLIKKVMIRLI